MSLFLSVLVCVLFASAGYEYSMAVFFYYHSRRACWFEGLR